MIWLDASDLDGDGQVSHEMPSTTTDSNQDGVIDVTAGPVMSWKERHGQGPKYQHYDRNADSFTAVDGDRPFDDGWYRQLELVVPEDASPPELVWTMRPSFAGTPRLGVRFSSQTQMVNNEVVNLVRRESPQHVSVFVAMSLLPPEPVSLVASSPVLFVLGAADSSGATFSGLRFFPYTTRPLTQTQPSGFPYPLTDARTEFQYGGGEASNQHIIRADYSVPSLQLRERFAVMLFAWSWQDSMGEDGAMSVTSSDRRMEAAMQTGAGRPMDDYQLVDGRDVSTRLLDKASFNPARVVLGRISEALPGANAVVHEMLVYVGDRNTRFLDAHRIAVFNYLNARWDTEFAATVAGAGAIYSIYQVPGTLSNDQAVSGFGQDMALVGCAASASNDPAGAVAAGESGGLTISAWTNNADGRNVLGAFSDHRVVIPSGRNCQSGLGASGTGAYLAMTHDGGDNAVQFSDGGSGVAANKIWNLQASEHVGSCAADGISQASGSSSGPFGSNRHFLVDLTFDLGSLGFSFTSTPTAGYELIGSPPGDRSVLTSMARIPVTAAFHEGQQTVSFRLPASCAGNRSLGLRVPIDITMQAYGVDPDSGLADPGSPLSGTRNAVDEGDTVYLRIQPFVPLSREVAMRLSLTLGSAEVKAVGGEATGQDFAAFITDQEGDERAFFLDGGTVILPANEPFVDIRVHVFNDDFVETTEEDFEVTLAAIVSGGALFRIATGADSEAFRIRRDDRARLDVDLSDADQCLDSGLGAVDVCVVEGSAEHASAVIEIRPLSAPEDGEVYVRLTPLVTPLFSLSADSLSFNRFNWETPISIVVTARQDDQAFVGDFTMGTFTVELNDGTDSAHPDVLNREPDFLNGATTDSSLTNIGYGLDSSGDRYAYPRVITVGRVDDDRTSIVVDVTDVSVSENSGRASVNVRLGSEPSSSDAPVTLAIASNDVSVATVSLARLIFRQSNWNVPQPINIIGEAGEFVGDRSATVELSVDDETSDALYRGATEIDVSVSVIGSREPGIVAEPSPSSPMSPSTLVLDESGIGRSGRVLVDLLNRPQMPVTLRMAFTGISDIVTVTCPDAVGGIARCSGNVASGWQLRYDEANWNVPIDIAMVAVDNTTRGVGRTSLALSVESGSDPAFVSDAAPASIEIEIEDDDTPGIVVTQEGLVAVPRTGLTIAENGESIDLLARLQVPSDGSNWTVVVDVAPLGTGNIGVSPSQLTFTDTDYSQSQRVTVTAIDDDFVRDDSDSLRFVVNQEATTAADYLGAPRRSVRFTLANDDVGSIMLSASTLMVREDGSAAVGVRLGMSPGQQQDIVSLVVDELGANVRLSGAGASLVFTGNDWDQMRDLEIEAVDDNFLGNRTATLTVRVDPNQTGAYSDATVTPKSVDITVLSEDRAGLNFACDACSGRVTTQGDSPLDSDLTADSMQAQTISLPEGGCVVYTVELTAFPIGGREVVVRFPPGAGEDGFTYADGEDCGMLASLGPREAIDVALSASMPTRRFLVVASDDEVYSGPGTATAIVRPEIVGTEFSGVTMPELTVEISGDDDIPKVSFDALSASATAAFSEDDGVLVLPVRLSNPSQVPVTVRFGFDPDAEAQEGVRGAGDVDYDFTVNNNENEDDTMTLVFEPLVVVLRDALRLEVLGDEVYEDDEDFELRMVAVVNGRPGEKLELTIFDNEPPPSLFLRTTDTRVLVGADAVVGGTGTGIAEGISPTIFVSVELTGIALEDVVVDLVVQGDTAQGHPAERDDYRLRCLSGCSPVSVDAETGAAMVTVTLSRSAPVAVVEIGTTSDTETLDAEDIIIRLENPTEGFEVSSSGTLKLRVLEDNIAPVLPGDLEVDRVDGGSAELSWEQATDNRSAADALVYELYTAPAPVPSDMSIQGSRLFVHRLDPTEIETNADGTRFVFRVAGLYPLTQYAWTLTVTDEAGNVAKHEDVTRSTSGPIDSDGDGLPDHFVAADGLAEDFDNDSLSDDLERFMSSGISATSAHPTDDVNGNRIPDSVEIGLGFPALDVLPAAYSWTTPGAVGRQVLGSSTQHTMAVTDSELLAAHLVEPYTQMTYSRAGTSLPLGASRRRLHCPTLAASRRSLRRRRAAEQLPTGMHAGRGGPELDG